VDANQEGLVKFLRRIPGVSVAVTSSLGGGFPDLVVGFNRRNYLLEVKDGTKPPSKRALTEDERTFHHAWHGQVEVVSSPSEALDALGIKMGKS
jgi:hypothetical protein